MVNQKSCIKNFFHLINKKEIKNDEIDILLIYYHY